MKEDDKEHSTIKVTDRRRFTTEGEERSKEEAPTPPNKASNDSPSSFSSSSENVSEKNVAIDFSTFIFSLASSVHIHLGLMPHPETKKSEKNLPLARQTIDILSMLEEKTKGNLTADEAKLFQALLYDLRLQFVEIQKGGKL